MYILFLIIIIVISLVIIGTVIFRKLPRITKVNSLNTPIVKQFEVKRRLLEERFGRKFSGGFKKLSTFSKPAGNYLTVQAKNLYQKLIELEEKYRHKALQASFKDKVNKQQFTDALISEAEEYIIQEKYNEAEKKYIEILSLDEQNVAAYQGLGKLYLSQKDYEHAKETFEFLLKFKEDDPLIYRSLGQIASEKGDLKKAQEELQKSLELDSADVPTYLDLSGVYINLEDPEKAFEMVLKAASLEPNNPRVLDFLIDISIIVRDKETALKAYHKLKEVNPDNQKLSELKDKIDKL